MYLGPSLVPLEYDDLQLSLKSRGPAVPIRLDSRTDRERNGAHGLDANDGSMRLASDGRRDTASARLQLGCAYYAG